MVGENSVRIICDSHLRTPYTTIQALTRVMRYIVEKGFVTVDGISLTVAKVGEQDFSVSAILHMVAQTVLEVCRVGSEVNLETDIVGKYIEKLLGINEDQQNKSGIDRAFLNRCRFYEEKKMAEFDTIKEALAEL